MTLDEVIALSADELQAKAAELAGWKRVDKKPANWPKGKPIKVRFTGQTFQPRKGPWWCLPDIPIEQCPINGIELPDYPNDIAAAWELLSTIKKIDGERMLRQQGFVEALPGFLEIPWQSWADMPSYAFASIFFNLTAKNIVCAFVFAMTQEEKDE